MNLKENKNNKNHLGILQADLKVKDKDVIISSVQIIDPFHTEEK